MRRVVVMNASAIGTSEGGMIRGIGIWGLAVSMAIGALTGHAALAEDDVMGKWFTVQEINGLPQPTWLIVKGLEHGKSSAAIIEYSKPRQCNLQFEYGGLTSAGHVFYIDGWNGGYCAEIGQKKPILRLKISSDGNLIYEISSQSQAFEKGILKRGG